jgi:hypothetical protein
MNKQKRFLAISNWYDKETGQPKTSVGEISEGIGKKNGKSYQITETKNTIPVDGIHPVGTILGGTMTLTFDTPTQNVKINTAEK